MEAFLLDDCARCRKVASAAMARVIYSLLVVLAVVYASEARQLLVNAGTIPAL